MQQEALFCFYAVHAFCFVRLFRCAAVTSPRNRCGCSPVRPPCPFSAKGYPMRPQCVPIRRQFFIHLPADSVPQEHIRSFKETIIGFLIDQEVILKLTAERKELPHRCAALKRRGKGSGADTKGRLYDPVGGKTVTRSLRTSKTLIAEKQSGGTVKPVPPLAFLRVC